MSFVEKSRAAERVSSFVFHSRGPLCRRVIWLHSDCLVSWHSYGWLIKWRCDKSAIFFLLDGGCCVTKRQNQGPLNPDETLRGCSGIKPGFQRLVLRVQLYCATKFTSQCCSEDFQGSDEISMCCTASSERSFNLHLIFILFYFLLVWPASWSSGQGLWLLIVKSRVRFPALPSEFSLKGKIPAVTVVWVD